MKLSVKKCLFFLFSVAALLLAQGCYHHSWWGSTDSFKDHEHQSLSSGSTLPQSFVSVGIKEPDGVFVPIAGGFLIHPGVVLTSAEEISRHLSSRSEAQKAHREDHLFVTFHDSFSSWSLFLEGKSKHEVRVDRAYKRRELMLLFFSPPKDLPQIQPLMLATTDDVRDLEDIADQNFLAVLRLGDATRLPARQVDLNAADPDADADAPNMRDGVKLCPIDTRTRLVQVNLEDHLTSRERQWASLMMDVFPGEFEEALDICFKVKESVEFKELLYSNSDILGIDKKIILPYVNMSSSFSSVGDFAQNRKDLINAYSKNRLTASEYRISLEKDAAPKSKSKGAFQCAQHGGYPLLWQSPSGVWKVLAFFSETSHAALLADDLIYHHSWIKNTINSHHGENHHFTLDQKVMQSFDQSLEKMLKQSQHSSIEDSFIAQLGYKNSKGEYGAICKGALIEKGVVLTAGHCLTHAAVVSALYKPFLVFEIGGKRHEAPVDHFEIHPKYQLIYGPKPGVEPKDDLVVSQLEEAGTHDIALAFFHQKDELKSIKPIAWQGVKEEVALQRAATSHAELWSTAGYFIRENYFFSKTPHMLRYRWYRLVPIQSVADLVENITSSLFSRTQRISRVINYVQDITGEVFDENDLLTRSADVLAQHPRYPSLQECLNPKEKLCALPHKAVHRLERAKLGCIGDSGSPLVWRDARQGKEQVIAVTSAFQPILAPMELFKAPWRKHCGESKGNVYARLSASREWIEGVLAARHQR